MKTFELKKSKGDERLFISTETNESIVCVVNDCDINDVELILIGKKDFESLLANQKKPGKKDLVFGSVVMVSSGLCNDWWRLGTYASEGGVKIIGGDYKTFVGFEHIIPFDIFDLDDPDKWNCTENDYGLKGKGGVCS